MPRLKSKGEEEEEEEEEDLPKPSKMVNQDHSMTCKTEETITKMDTPTLLKLRLILKPKEEEEEEEEEDMEECEDYLQTDCFVNTSFPHI